MISPSGHSRKSEIHSFSISRLRGLLFPQLILYQSSIQQRLLLNRLLSTGYDSKGVKAFFLGGGLRTLFSA